MSLQDTPNSQRLNIGIFGRTNAGKSSLMNAITNQNSALVSSVPGTTTDPVFKAMELPEIGPVVFIDTAGFGDKTELGAERLKKTEDAVKRSDLSMVIFSTEEILSINHNAEKQNIETCFAEEFALISQLKKEKRPFITIITKTDLLDKNKGSKTASETDLSDFEEIIDELTGEESLKISSVTKKGIENISEEILRRLPEDFKQKTLTGSLCKENDVVLLVMPQDIQAPKGRLILPQVQTIRELLDKKCSVLCCTTDKFVQTLGTLKNNPDLIITDSQAFKFVYENKPKESPLTSFSVLLAANKGDIGKFIEGAKAISKLNNNSKVLIAEACTHSPLEEDIGRIKIPALLRKMAKGISITHVSGKDFPENLKEYDLIIHCGGCMFNGSYIKSRQNQAEKEGVPMTNYGITIAYINGILDKIVMPC